MALKDKKAEGKTEETTTTTTQDETPQPDEKKEEVAVREPAGAMQSAATPGAFCTDPDILDAVADASYGTYPSITASNGTHKVAGGKEGEELGKVVTFQPIITKNSWKVTPGSNDEEARDYFCVSDDGEFVNDGRSIEEALQDAKNAGYNKAAIKKYIDVICLIVNCDNEDYIGETVTLQLAPSSQYSWKPLAGKVKMKAALGTLKAKPFAGQEDKGHVVVFKSTAKATSWKGNDFTKFEFSLDS